MTEDESCPREILEKHWKNFRLSTGMSYEPMIGKAYECFEAAMIEYSNSKKDEKEPILKRVDILNEVYNKWHELDNDFFFIEWLSKEVQDFKQKAK